METSRDHGSGELAAIAWLTDALGRGAHQEVRVGDDTAVFPIGEQAHVLFATDLVVEHTHFDRSLSSLADVGWKVLAANVSDVAAMGGRPLRAVVGVVGARGDDLQLLYDGLIEASVAYDCPVVGGDLSDGRELVVSVAIVGVVRDRAPVLRSGAQPGDLLFVTGPLGSAAAGLRLLRVDQSATGALVDAHRRPLARLLEGETAAQLGAHAMIDLSDGLGLDLHRVADASGVGFTLWDVPVAAGASDIEAVTGGEDFELLFCAPPGSPVQQGFARAGLRPPISIGSITADPTRRELAGEPFVQTGYEHRVG